MYVFEQAKKELKEEIKDIEGNDIEEGMFKKARDWIQEYKATHNGQPPASME